MTDPVRPTGTIWLFYRGDLSLESGESTRMALLLSLFREMGLWPRLFLISLEARRVVPAITRLAEVDSVASAGSVLRDLRTAGRVVRKAWALPAPAHIVVVSSFWLALAPRLRGKWRNATLVWSMHGIQEERVADKRQTGLPVRMMKAVEAFGLRWCDGVVTVSGAMTKYVRTDLHFRRSSYVLPCVVDAARFSLLPALERSRRRAEWGWADDDVVLVYCGSIRPWQCVEETAAFWAHLSKMDDRYRFLMITPEPERASEIGAAAGLDRTKLVSIFVPHDQIPAMLQLANVGVLLRKRSIVNEVASPTKIAEYLAAGLYVLASGGVGDVADWLGVDYRGLVLDPGSSPSVLARVAHVRLTDPAIVQWGSVLMRHDYANAQLSSGSHAEPLSGFLGAKDVTT